MTKKNDATHENNLGPAIGVLELPQREGNPRNSEGAYITLKDGRIMFVYSHYTAGNGGDHDPAFLAGRFSSDGGQTWTTDDVLVVSNEGGMNVMSVSLLRLQSGKIALFYALKNSERDCRPLMRLSHDEGQTWRRSHHAFQGFDPEGTRVAHQEPGVVELSLTFAIRER